MTEDNIHPESEAEYHERREALMEDAAKTKRELTSDQEAILSDIQEEHGGELIETPVTITANHQATIRTKVDGALLNRLESIEERVDAFQSGEASVSDISGMMDTACEVLADMIADPEFDKALFYGAYESEGPEVIGIIIERVFEAIEEEQKRKQGAVDGFRSE